MQRLGWVSGAMSELGNKDRKQRGPETGERMTATRTGAAQKALELEMIPESLFVLSFFPKGKIRRAQTPIWTWMRVG